ncbi:MAG TPA: SDR family NAD(P)-dependent oxidoreductase [Jiangellaceae bacterium]|nr:SDR family NAD(P)-dependent oxidoreductase [Jiangellaceae bacterium]
MRRFESRTALVTGAAQGIGRAVAERLASEGANLVLLDIEPEALERTVRQLRVKDWPVEAVSGDVAERADVRRAVELAVERFDGLDVLAGIAGITEFSSVLELRDESWRRILDVNLTGMFIATQEAGRVMAARGRGAIVLMASTNAFYPEAHTAPYSTSKAGLVGFVRAASLDLGQHGIRINAVNPGIINTRLSKLLIDDPIGGPEYLRRIPLRRWGEPADIAAVVAFLASDDAGYMTGEDVTADAGATVGVVLEVEDVGLGEHGSGRAGGDG